MSTSAIIQVTIPQGALWRVAWPVFTPAGAPVDDLRDWQIRADVRPDADSPRVLHTWTYPDPDGPGNVEVFRQDALNAAGQLVGTDWFRLIVRPADSSPWTWTFGVAQIELERAPGEVARPVELWITVSRETTRPTP